MRSAVLTRESVCKARKIKQRLPRPERDLIKTVRKLFVLRLFGSFRMIKGVMATSPMTLRKKSIVGTLVSGPMIFEMKYMREKKNQAQMEKKIAFLMLWGWKGRDNFT